jgi:hypothetical protein
MIEEGHLAQMARLRRPPGILNPPAMGKLTDKIPSQAKIVFIGACNLDRQYLQQHFTISPFLQITPGSRAIVGDPSLRLR